MTAHPSRDRKKEIHRQRELPCDPPTYMWASSPSNPRTNETNARPQENNSPSRKKSPEKNKKLLPSPPPPKLPPRLRWRPPHLAAS
ncbi:hypothetical protein VTJ04DRAFT_1294 [Mycothermus thermophilus]|uniref:uncharacterized protein n=1 Tax=Humicola insolens TaxID=85995 RepID=UPI00374299AD